MQNRFANMGRRLTRGDSTMGQKSSVTYCPQMHTVMIQIVAYVVSPRMDLMPRELAVISHASSDLDMVSTSHRIHPNVMITPKA